MNFDFHIHLTEGVIRGLLFVGGMLTSSLGRRLFDRAAAWFIREMGPRW